ncbi:MAG TPA: rhodanese-like domain-containing protein [Hyphomicrobium sp.]|nr:rhodanese-like domain-containing protein [Hyphomicrobium sp.]
MSTRREFLEHAGAFGLGAVFLTRLGGVAHGAAARAGTAVTKVPGLILETIEAGGISHYSYFIGDTITGAAAVIDPKRDVDDYIELARKHRLTITHAIDTHIHADFVSGARELAHRTGAAVCASTEGGAAYGYAVQPLRDGAVLEVGDLRLQAIHTPGHTPEHMSYLASRRGKPNDYWGLFTGDFLFAGAVGRPDLMGVENTDRLARLLYQSVQSAYTALPDALPIYPAHGPGSPCGAGIVQRDGIPTLGIERELNPALQFKDEEKFIEDLLFSQPPVPYYWPRMKQINARGPEVLGELPTPHAMAPKEFKTLVQSGTVQLLDTRHMLAFGGAHVPHAINIGHSPSVSMWGGWLLNPEQPIALVVPSKGAEREVVAWLARVGLMKFAAVLDVGKHPSGMDAWVMEGEDFTAIPQLSVHDLRKRMVKDEIQVFDVRQPQEWDQGHLPGARFMFLPEIQKRMTELDKSKPIAVYCGTGYRASIAASLLKRASFNVYSVPGSFGGWLEAGYDVIVPPAPGRASDTRRA